MFEDAWARYTPLKPEQWNTPNTDGPESPISALEQLEQLKSCSTSENAGSVNNDGLCSSVPVAQGGEGGDVALDCCKGGVLLPWCRLCKQAPNYWKNDIRP